MENLESVIKIFSLISAIVSVVFGKFSDFFLNYPNKRNLRKISNIKEIDFIIDKLDDKFKKEFIFPNLREIFFFIQTGIYTNANSIQKYIDLKNKLGKNFTWKSIKLAKGYLIFEDNILKIKISTTTIFFTKLMLVIACILFILDVFIIYLYSSDTVNFTSKDWIKFLSMLSIPLISSIFILYSIAPAMMASAIKRNMSND